MISPVATAARALYIEHAHHLQPRRVTCSFHRNSSNCTPSSLISMFRAKISALVQMP